MRAAWGDSAFVLAGCAAVDTVALGIEGAEGFAAAAGCAVTTGFTGAAGCAATDVAGLGAGAPTVTDTFFLLFVSFIIKSKNSLASDSFKTFFEPCDSLSNARAAHVPNLSYSLNYW